MDAPRVLGLRYQYLNLDLSPAEQRVFFAEFGQALERLLQQGFGAIDQRLCRLEFLQECQKQLVNASVVITMYRPLTAKELGHYRFLTQIINLEERDPHPTLWIGGREAYSNLHHNGTTVLLTGTKTLAWSCAPDERLQDTTVGGGRTTRHLEAWVHLAGRGPFQTLSTLDRKVVTLWVTKPLLPQIESIFLIVNGHALAGGYVEQLRIREEGPPPKWLEALAEEEAKIPWVAVLKRLHDLQGRHPDLDFSPWHLDFSQFTPRKIYDQEG